MKNDILSDGVKLEAFAFFQSGGIMEVNQSRIAYQGMDTDTQTKKNQCNYIKKNTAQMK